ncbi:hypothetical protein [Sphingomonas sp. Y38-1Y]|uniref:hypothetical protein n=1 Tax=Sphingomonas sp. Y38-1Y TaxID=3078265 RepID=UPI0028E914C3|nr:hypothetical protein [Sphingomonas sp. Y38-1Y]
MQLLGWIAYEAADHHGAHRTDYEWSTYPILRFGHAPRSVVVEIVDRPGTPFFDTGECAQGLTAAALTNALFAADGTRLRSLPVARSEARVL